MKRYSLNSQPQEFLSNPEVLPMVRKRQLAVLPITLVDGKMAETGEYPTLEEVQQALSLSGRPQ